MIRRRRGAWTAVCVMTALAAVTVPVALPVQANHYDSACVKGFTMYTSAPMYTFGVGPWMSGGFGGTQTSACPVNGYGAGWYSFGGAIAGYCGFATGSAEFSYGYRIAYVWAGAVMVAYGYNPTVPNTLQPLHLGTYTLAPNVATGHTCTNLGGASEFTFVGVVAQHFVGWA